ncbi:MAG: sensor histidine kinase [Corynebacterium sp.]|uniref:sensor histidine kinase n=1 Tax=Corynebacterium sp. TaxID=1720 RepID=UPI003F9EAB44
MRFTRRLPLGAVETLFAAIIAGAELWIMNEELTVLAVAVAVLMVGLVAITARYPVLASLLSLFLLTSAFALGELAPIFSLFLAALVLEIVVARGQLTIGIFLALAQWALSTVDPVNQILVTDPMSLAMVAFVLIVAYMIGWNRHNNRRRQQTLRNSLAEQEREQRLELARELHDSVATSLTSVVMRAQALTLLPPGQEEQHAREGLEEISDSSRSALDQLRTMLRLLNEEPSSPAFRARADAPPLKRALSNAAKELKAHDLKVVTKFDLPRDVARVANRSDDKEGTWESDPWFDRDTVAKVLTEMVSNAAKHSTRHSTVILDCHVEETCLVLTMTNEVAVPALATDDSSLSSGLGLGSMQARASKAGGVLLTGPVEPEDMNNGHPDAGESNAPLWRTALRLPIVVSEP